jgi:hypothetical protein
VDVLPNPNLSAAWISTWVKVGEKDEVVQNLKVVDQSESTVPRAENEPFTYAEFRALLDHPPIATKRTENGGKLKCPQSEITTYSSHGHTSLERCGRLIPAQATAL